MNRRNFLTALPLIPATLMALKPKPIDGADLTWEPFSWSAIRDADEYSWPPTNPISKFVVALYDSEGNILSLKEHPCTFGPINIQEGDTLTIVQEIKFE